MGLNLEASIGLNSAQFERGMHRVKDSVADSVKSFVIGAIGIGTVEEAFRRTIETADELVNSAKRLDMTVEQVQLLRQAAKDSGIEFEALANSIAKIDVARAKALGGDKASLAAFGALGVNRKDLQSKTATNLFTQNIGDTLKSTNVEQIAAPLREILGRGATQVVGVLKTNFDDLGQKMKLLGAIMDTKTAVELKQFKDEIGFIGSVLTSQFAPILVKISEAFFKLFEVLQITGTVYGTLVQSWLSGHFKNSWNEAGDAGREVKDGFDKIWSDFQKQIQDESRALDNPKPPDFEKTAETAKKMRGEHRERRTAEDSLIKVGNFLGSSRAVINNAQAMLVQHAANTERNTRVTAEAVTKLASSGLFMNLARGNSLEDTAWPAN